MNNYCKVCKVSVKSDIVNCPLCGRFIDGNDGELSPTSYYVSSTPQKDKADVVGLIGKIVNILTLIAVFVNAFINIYMGVFFRLEYLWSIYVVAGALLLYLCVLIPIKKRKFKWDSVTLLFILVCAYLVVIDLLDNVRIDWSLTYVVPFVFSQLSVLLILLVFAWKKEDKANEYLAILLSFLGSAVLTIVLTVLHAFKVLVFPLILPYMALAITLAVLLLAITFKNKSYFKNLFKKFHA